MWKGSFQLKLFRRNFEGAVLKSSDCFSFGCSFLLSRVEAKYNGELKNIHRYRGQYTF